MEKNKKIESIEYEIRKLERGIKVAHRCLLNIRGTSVDYDFMIKQYVKNIKELRDRLERLTEKKCFSSGRWKILVKGRRRPNISKWPL